MSVGLAHPRSSKLEHAANNNNRTNVKQMHPHYGLDDHPWPKLVLNASKTRWPQRHPRRPHLWLPPTLLRCLVVAELPLLLLWQSLDHHKEDEDSDQPFHVKSFHSNGPHP